MITSTVENYLKALFLLDQHGEKKVSTGELAKSLEVTPGSATSMIKTLAEAGLVEHLPHYGVMLTSSGRTLAIHVVRRHRIVELFLVEILGMDWSKVHDEAEQLEHVVSDEVIERMDVLLERPTLDPHGDPIPQPDGTLPTQRHCSLSGCMKGQKLSVARMNDQDAEFLRFAEDHGLVIGAKIEILNRNESADSLTIKTENDTVVLGLSAAANIEVLRA
ncbi:MAG: metal-dependent transcriptional regulator [Phycisphaerales bacterium]|jgi:DtxR family Mn-dependent transcriptional regulator|nr:metal-dependent transcriptional regulator [Phycisphaerales bacterium]